MFEIYLMNRDGHASLVYATPSQGTAEYFVGQAYANGIYYKVVRLTEAETRHYTNG